MQTLYRLEFCQEPSAKDERILLDGIDAEAVKLKGMLSTFSFGIFIKDSQGKTVGGVRGAAFYGCLHVDMLWMEESLRHQGWGTKLMNKAELTGRAQECLFATVNTMDWQALPFYEKLGYKIEFVREGFAKQSKMYLLKKQLTGNFRDINCTM